MGFTHPKGVKAMQGWLRQPKSNQEPNTGKKSLKPTSAIVPRPVGKPGQPIPTTKPRK